MSKKSRAPGSSFRQALEIFTLWAFAVAQPIFELVSRGADFLLAHRLEPADLLALVVAIGFLPPAVLVLLEWLERAVPGRSRLHALWVALLAAAIVLQALNGLAAGIAVPGMKVAGVTVLMMTVAVAVFLGSLFAFASARWSAKRLFVAFLSPAVLIFPALFLLRPPVSGLLFPRTVETDAPRIVADTPVVLVVLDELPIASLMDRNRRIDDHRYPAFAELAGHSHWFRNATSVAESTKYAVPAILTGRYPDGSRLAHLGDYPENLFTWLGASYPMNVFETLTRMCPQELRRTTELEESFGERMRSTLRDLSYVYLHLLLPEGLAAGLPAVTSTWRDFGGAGSPVQPAEDPTEPHQRRGASAQVFSSFVESIRPTRRGVLHFLHLNLPHLPWKYLPSGKEYGPPDARLRPHGLRGEQWIDDQWATIQGFQRHLLQVAYTDRLVGRLIARLRDAGIYYRSLVIVTADHGVSFWPGQSRREATEKTRSDILAVPLFVKTPFQKQGVVSDRNVEIIDILPTIVDVLDAETPWPVDGSSALDDSRPARGEKVLIDTAAGKIVGRMVMGEWIAGQDATLERMFSLFGSGTDPGNLFRIGDFRHLVDREPSELPLAAGSGLEVDFSDARSFENLDPDASYLPARIVGALGPATDSEHDLAVAVNGRIRAVTRSHDSPAGAMFAAMVPEDSFQRGFNRVEVFEILDGADGAETRLAAISTRPAVRFVLHSGPGVAERISTSDGRWLRIVPDAVAGEVVFNGVSFRGWAARIEPATVADSILLFSGGELITRTNTGEFRPDIARRFQQRALTQAGFSFVVPYSIIEDPGSPELRFFATVGDLASPLPFRDAWTRQ